MSSALFNSLRLPLVVLFGAATLACLIGTWRASKAETSSVRRSLVAFLGCSTAWAGAHVGYLLATGPVLQYAFYDLGLVVGFAAVAAWLWFCSAYAGRDLHRRNKMRQLALVVVGLVTITKVTNPLHGLYFTVAKTAVPFTYLQVDHHGLYWISLGVSYVLAAVGAFVLFESLVRVRANTRPLAALIGLMALPGLLNAVGYASSHLPNITYEPLGVAVFAVGTLFFYEGQFRDVQLSGSEERPALVVGPGGRMRSYNEAAAEILPRLRGREARGKPLTEVAPSLAEGLSSGQRSVELWPERSRETGRENWETSRRYEVTESRFGGPAGDGRLLVLTDVTERELRHRKLERDRRLLSKAVNQAQESVLITEASPLEAPGPRIVYVNEAFEQMTGYKEEEVLGETPRILQGPETDRAILDSLREALEAGEEWEGETINYRKDGEPYVVRWDISPVIGEDDEIEYWVSVQRDVTEERKREEKLRRQKSLLGQTQKLAGAWEVDLQSEELMWSEKMYRIYELKPGTKVTLEEALSFYPPEGREKLREAFDRCIEEGTPYDVEVPLVTAQENRRWVRAVGAPVTTDGGEVLKVAGALQDITERKRAEETLREQEAQLRGLTNSIPGVVFQAYARPERDYGFYFVSDHAEEVMGISAEPEGFLERCMDRAPESERERLMNVIDEAVEREGPLKFEAPFVKPSGETIWLLGTTTPEARADELIYNGVILDITERKEQEKRLSQIARRVTDAIVEVDSEWRFTLVNEQAETLYDMVEEDLLGEELWDVFEGALGTRFEEEYRKVMQTREPTRFEEYYSGLDGWFDVQVYPNDDGGLAFYFEEITERKERERKLREAKEEAEEANRLKSVFLANMSHEIRTPLTSILGFAEAIGDGAGSEEEETVLEFARLIEQSGQRLMSTLTGVLNLSKLQAGEMDLDLGPVDLVAEAEETIEEFGPQARKAGIDLNAQFGSEAEEGGAEEGQAEGDQKDDPVWARADEGGVQIVLRNLLSNAIKYTGEGGEVWVRVRTEEEMVAVEVEDTGIGMDPEKAEGLFEAFKQASEGIGRRYEGTGLGLTVTKEVLSQMGGSIEVETEKGAGSRFTVWLPRS